MPKPITETYKGAKEAGVKIMLKDKDGKITEIKR